MRDVAWLLYISAACVSCADRLSNLAPEFDMNCLRTNYFKYSVPITKPAFVHKGTTFMNSNSNITLANDVPQYGLLVVGEAISYWVLSVQRMKNVDSPFERAGTSCELMGCCEHCFTRSAAAALIGVPLQPSRGCRCSLKALRMGVILLAVVFEHAYNNYSIVRSRSSENKN